jgi:hypothetical protein
MYVGRKFGPKIASLLTGRTSRRRGEIEVAKRHPLKALKVFALIFFDVIAEIRHERKYRKELRREPLRDAAIEKPEAASLFQAPAQSLEGRANGSGHIDRSRSCF